MQHLAMIMDGNRRWARKQGFTVLHHREKAVHAVQLASEFCIENNIPYLTLFMLSLENYAHRKKEILDHIFRLTIEACEQKGDDLVRNGIRIRFVGQRDLYPKDVMSSIQNIEKKTASVKKLLVSLCFFYGARQEIVQAAQQLARNVAAGALQADDITYEHMNNVMWTAGTPDPDLLIRTGGQENVRLSNFLLFQSAYTELQFVDFYWPDLTKKRLSSCLENFKTVKRNFGR